jgi:hypothetical protein
VIKQGHAVMYDVAAVRAISQATENALTQARAGWERGR